MRKKKFTANFGLNTSSWMRKKRKEKEGEKNLKGRRKNTALEVRERCLLDHACPIKNTM